MCSCGNTEIKLLLSYIDLAEAKNKAPINEKNEEIHLELSLRSVEN